MVFESTSDFASNTARLPQENEGRFPGAAPRLVKLSPGPGRHSGFMNKEKAEAWSLVLLSVNITHRMIQSSIGWEILVDESNAVTARYHLEQYEAENSQWPPVVSFLPQSKPVFSRWSFLFFTLLVVFFMLTGPWSGGSVFFDIGAVRASLIKQDLQLWRVITALTLHADVVHLLGNICLGGVLIAFLSGLTGTGSAWLLTLLSGAVGNMMNVMFHAGSHNSVGFSTAVFGVIGAFCGIRAFRDGVVTILLPLGAGFGLLAMLGAGGERTDLGAHIWGLFSGIGFGAGYYFLDQDQIISKNQRLQNSLAIFVLFGVLLSWLAAFSN